jgi:predicted nucleotidyltransferase
MEPSFEKLLVLLAERGVRFVVVGGIAVTLQGYVRLTEDVDLLI